MQHFHAEDYKISTWSGGRTIQIAISPEGAEYADRDFLWRLSSATVDLEESDFTSLPDYDRLIAPLTGTMELSHNGGAGIALEPYQVHAFDGADATHSIGCCTDFNLMLRKGRCDGKMEMLQAAPGCTELKFCPDPKAETVIFYCAAGNVDITAEMETAEASAEMAGMAETQAVMLRPAEALRLDDGEVCPLILKLTPEARIMAIQIWRK